MSIPSHTNRLSRETSPYLLQHQHNPVDWYPWGEEAFAAAREQGKPIFLSVGYSTCYWCHVMERECFENDSIAALMNEKFINIKVDREERPDVDQLYMTAVQVLTQHGGWPMSVWLTPDRRPFYGGTYFPPDDTGGRPGFPTLLNALSDAWANRPEQIEKSADQLVSILKQLAQPTPPDRDFTIDEAWIDAMIGRSTSDYEPIHGGFGSAPKFPRETLLELLLTHHAHHPDEERATMIRHTLDAMANGGIRDHLGGGFHRYSTDAKWLVPHFEIMLYDNAMLGWCYVEAFRQFNEERYATVARGVFDFVLRELTAPSGAFYTALDAEVDGQEGLNYLWTRDEIDHILKKGDITLFSQTYGLDRGPNFADPHHSDGTPDTNILYLPDGAANESDPTIIAMRQALLEERRKRKQPRLDDKILTSWNALMIHALAFAGKVLQEPRFTNAAIAAAKVLLDRLDNRLRTLDDDAFLAMALLELHEVTGDASWREHAWQIATALCATFEDSAGGGFFFASANASDLIVRQKSASDSPLPSGNAVAASVFMRLDQPDVSKRVIQTFAGQLEQAGESMSALLLTADAFVRRHGAIEVKAGAPRGKADRPLTPQQLAASVVTLRGTWIDPQTLRLNVRILKGFHIHAHEAGEDFIATRLDVSRGDDDALDAMVEYPPGAARRFAFAEEDVHVYEGRVSITVHFAKSQRGGSSLNCALSYQPCDETSCLPGVTQQFEVPGPD